MSPEQECQALDIAMQVAEVAAPLRAELLSHLCGGDQELRTAVEKLRSSLEAVAKDDFLGQPALAQVSPSAVNSHTFDADETNPSTAGSPDASEPARLPKAGRFRPIERLGLGGQGEVWKALDPELDRCVALKVVKRGLQGSLETITKFRREAEVTGKLEHPNIVPVYEAGREDIESNTADSLPTAPPFYVMRVIGDQNLYEAIQAFHRGTWSESTLRKLLGHLIDVCNAMAYSHSRGVLHRDLKPQNVMLGDFGETLVVDWGLAKVVGRDEAHTETDGMTTVDIGGDDSQTRVGTIKGTPVYMSPEQARGEVDTLGPATDVYSLGAILFCILTGQPPITARPKAIRRNSGSADATPADSPRPQLSAAEIIERVRSGEFPRPTTIEPLTPRALEAIGLRAMSLQARDRYAKARDLAEDLQRWLDDEPVTAWPEPLTIRAKRWAKKHQAVVTSTAAALLMAAIGLSIGFVVVSGKNNELDQKNAALNKALDGEKQALVQSQNNERRAIKGEADAKSNAELAQRNESRAIEQELLAKKNAETATDQSRLALSTLNGVIFDLNRSLQDVPGGTEVRQRLLAAALPQLEKISTDFIAKSAVDRNTMAALNELADAIVQLGNVGHVAIAPAEGYSATNPTGKVENRLHDRSPVLVAERLYLRAYAIAKQLADRNPTDNEAQRDLSISLIKLGDVFLRLGRTDDALIQYEACGKLRRVLAEADPKAVQSQRDLAASFYRLGDVLQRLGRTDDARARYAACLEISRALAAADPNDASKQRELATSFDALGNILLLLGRTRDALTQHEACEKIRRVLAEADPDNSQNQRNLSISFSKLGDICMLAGRIDDALDHFQESLRIFRMLTAADPRNAQLQRDLAASLNRMGDAYLRLGRTVDAVVSYEDFMKINRVLADADPNDVQKQRDLAVSFVRLGDLYRKLGRSEDALKQFQAYESICRSQIASDPNDAQNQRKMSLALERIGDMLLMHGQSHDALAKFEDGLKISRMLAQADES